jgi:RNA polymerase sigma-70 factor (ECF subfamily)
MPAASDPTRWLEEHGNALYRFALGRLRDLSLAEDAVQETLLGALKNVGGFEGRAEERTWLIGILRRKIADQLRKAGRLREESVDTAEPAFDKSGRWAAPPGEWHDPEGQLEKSEFQAQFHMCLEKLPETLAEAFLMREVEGLEYEQVCDQLELSATNLSTRLYRARLLLRKCLEENWFEGGAR